ncbi:IclR family transcriptional regulator [Pseudonocardia kongjuensis]|uniref:IclR family transcriptional regulator n=1 Tax=Pseudonocardia kongjuensis TaxID=102227 RepID=A0ABN1XJU3_9PSEU
MRSIERTAGPSVLGRAFSLLDVLSTGTGSLGLAELARRADLPKATAFRLANQLIELQVLERVGSEYQLGVKLFELGTGTRNQELREVALPFLEDLYEAVHETIHLAVIDGSEVLYVEKIVGRRTCAASSARGARKPMYTTALGKAMLAFAGPRMLETVVQNGLVRRTPYTISTPGRLHQDLQRIRESGVAYDREEHDLGITCVASPLLDRQGRSRGAISVTGPTTRFKPERFAPAVRTAALGLNRRWLEIGRPDDPDG